MRTRTGYRLAAALIFALTWCGTLAAMAAQSWRIDEAHTSIGFKIDATSFPTTRGHFRHYTGRIAIDPDGRHAFVVNPALTQVAVIHTGSDSIAALLPVLRLARMQPATLVKIFANER